MIRNLKYLLVFSVFCSCISCGVLIDPATFYTRRAHKMIEKAAINGAKIKMDSVQRVFKVKIIGPRVRYKPQRITLYDTMTFYKDSVITRAVFVPSKAQQGKENPCADSVVYMTTACPDGVGSVTATVGTSVSATAEGVPKGWLYIAFGGGFLIAVGLCSLLVKLFK